MYKKTGDEFSPPMSVSLTFEFAVHFKRRLSQFSSFDGQLLPSEIRYRIRQDAVILSDSIAALRFQIDIPKPFIEIVFQPKVGGLNVVFVEIRLDLFKSLNVS